MKEEKRITYQAGITRTPSDFLCKDGELAECINLTTDNEELKPVVQPAEFINRAVSNPGAPVEIEMDIPTILYIHNFNGESRYIGYSYDDLMLWGTVENGTFYLRGYFYKQDPENPRPSFLHYVSGDKITSIGKTLIINSRNNGATTPYPKPGQLFYAIWNGTQYNVFNEIPKPEVEFFLYGTNDFEVKNTGEGGFWDGSDVSSNEQWNDVVIGVYSKNRKAIAQKKAFCQPFFVRYAVELYDGSYIHISQPILLFPSLTANSHYETMNLSSGVSSVKLATHYTFLYFINKTDLTAFSDLVKNVSLFVSDDINIYDTLVDQPFDYYSSDITIYDGIYRETLDGLSEYHNYTLPAGRKALKQKLQAEIERDIKSVSLFYKLCDIGLNGEKDGNDSWVAKNISDFIDTHTLENITTLERLEYDDYFSLCPLNAQITHSYNSRLNLAGVKRGFFDGYDFFLPYDDASPSSYEILVRIKTDSGNRVVRKKIESTYQKIGIWFYYPDPRADWVTINNGLVTILDAPLTEHSALNGAYYFNGYPQGNSGDTPTATTETIRGLDIDYSLELLENYVLQSEVDNPWIFKATGYNRVGTGRILAISTCTQALSQDQRGPSPLLVFSESGIWGMSVDNTGLYDFISSISREVCINPENIIQTDNAVFFVSKKGLMVAAQEGDYRNIVVRCVSEQMNGETFNTANLPGLSALELAEAEEDPESELYPWALTIHRCIGSESFLDYVRSTSLITAYDYVGSCILMLKPDKRYSYIYNIADGSISKVILPTEMKRAVNNYPDYLLQGDITKTVIVEGEEMEVVVENVLFSFYGKPREEQVTGRQICFLLTRPMKLSGPLTVKSLRELVNVGMWKEKDGQGNYLSCVKTEVWVADNLNDWYQMSSRFGAAAKYFRIALYIKMLPTERLSGTILSEQDRRDNNYRK